MFRLADKEQVPIPVKITDPDGETHAVKVYIKNLGRSGYDDLIEGFENQTDEQIVRGLIVGWRGIADSTGAELPFTPENLDALLNAHWRYQPVVFAVLEEISGARYAKRELEKN